jgi:protein-disulfide isomerase
MRPLLLLIPTLALFAQAPMHRTAATATPPKSVTEKNFKESGSPNAPLTLELYTDYQCPSCRTFFLDTLPSVMSEYVATGKVRLIHRDFPLPQHAYSKIATRYANAAGQVGMYEVAATQIFKTQAEWEQNGNVDGELAKVIPPGTMQKIRELVKSDSHLDDSVTADVALGNQDRLNQTPTMVIVSHGKRNKIDGPVPFNILKSYFDQLLAKG